MIRSRKILRHARGQNCTLRLDGCQNDRDTVVFAHINSGSAGKGMGIKAHDFLGVFACHHCHAALDAQRGRSALSGDVLRALCETLVVLVLDGLLKVPQDEPKPSSERPVKPRKPKAERAPITHRQNPWPKGRKLQSANTLRKRERTDA